MKIYYTQLTKIMDQIEAFIEPKLHQGWDYDREEGMMSLESPNGEIWLLNRHEPTQQIWLSSPKSGAHHFTMKADETWVSTQDPHKALLDLLWDEINP